jgi:hypothetical protein
MKLYDYIPEALLMQRIEEGYVNVNQHKKFPLAIYTYSKSATFDYMWDEATCKCRGLIVDLRDMTILARPFSKFFNVGEAAGITREQFPSTYPIITDKLDGNLITLYPWAGRWWAASKGSFHSKHADWANNWLFHHCKCDWPEGFTPVFEMIAEELEHHVVHYGAVASGLYLIALIQNESGAELNDGLRIYWAKVNDVPCIPVLNLTIDKALTDNDKNAEGYVLSWPRLGQTPVRVKIKFPEFLRLQKLVHNIGPKEILDYMRRPELKCYLDEVLDPERSHEVFIAYTKKWMSLFEADLNRVGIECNYILTDLYKNLTLQMPRKMWAEQIIKCKYPAIMFAQLDYELAALQADWSAEKNEKHKARIKDLMWDQVEPLSKQFDNVRSIITQEE